MSNSGKTHATESVRLLVVSGFLGAGKTTAITRIARHLIDSGRRVGLVTNDQAFGLVDTEALRSQGFDVGEVAGACFCCKFDDLAATLESLRKDRRPDVILAEPVGSCTDLAATVLEPIRRLHGHRYEIGPLVALLKPEHGRKILDAEPGTGFSPKAAYIFLKQIEEADLVVLNKIDMLSFDERRHVTDAVLRRFPGKRIVTVSAVTGEGFDELIEAMERPRPSERRTTDVDYALYAEGEAELGWLNATAHLVAEDLADPFSLDQLLHDFLSRLRSMLDEASAEPVHVKALATADGATAIVNLVSSDAPICISIASRAEARAARLLVNARVATDPGRLALLVTESLAATSRAHRISHWIETIDHFRPAPPVPTHRIVSGD